MEMESLIFTKLKQLIDTKEKIKDTKRKLKRVHACNPET